MHAYGAATTGAASCCRHIAQHNAHAGDRHGHRKVVKVQFSGMPVAPVTVQAFVRCLRMQRLRSLPSACRVEALADGVARADVPQQPGILHFNKMTQRLLPLRALFARADGGTSPRSRSASSHCAPLSHALMAALYVMTSGRRPLTGISPSSRSASSHCAPLSHALMAALYVMTSGFRPFFGRHLAEQPQGLLPPLALLACPGGRVVRENFRLQPVG